MMKINPALCFKPSDLIEYLRQAGRETTIAEEIAAAVAHRLIIEREFGWRDFFIYFEPRDTKQAALLQKIGSTVPYSELENFLKSYAAQDTPVDYAFVNVIERPVNVYPVQHKRFFPDKTLDATEDLIGMLTKWKHQYASTETTLLIHYRGDLTGVDLEAVMNWLNSNDYPFREVVVLLINETGPLFLQLLPNTGDGRMGVHQYTMEEMRVARKSSELI